MDSDVSIVGRVSFDLCGCRTDIVINERTGCARDARASISVSESQTNLYHFDDVILLETLLARSIFASLKSSRDINVPFRKTSV